MEPIGQCDAVQLLVAFKSETAEELVSGLDARPDQLE